MYCMQCFLKSKYTKSRTFNDKNRWIVKKVMVFKKLLQHLATRGTYSPGDWRCYEAWREQTLVYPPVMCQQRLIYCTWELNVMSYYCMSKLKWFDLLLFFCNYKWWRYVSTVFSSDSREPLCEEIKQYVFDVLSFVLFIIYVVHILQYLSNLKTDSWKFGH